MPGTWAMAKEAVGALEQHVPIVHEDPGGQILLPEHWQTALDMAGHVGSMLSRQQPPSGVQP